MKKIISILLALMLILSVSVPTFAATLDQNATSGSAEVSYTADSTYTVTIPDYIIPSEQSENATQYSVTAKDVLIGENEVLKTTVEYDGVMTDAKGAELAYDLYIDGQKVNSGDVILKQAAGNPEGSPQVNFTAIAESAKYAGVYTDTVVFNFSVGEKTYTLDEINADDHLFGIGATKSEYVIAEFNEDYTSAIIFKNGEDSDGKMRGYSSYTETSDGYYKNTPFYNRTTLNDVVILNGVTNIGIYIFNECTSLTNITIPDSVTKIERYAFRGCKSLTSINIPDSVTRIDSGAFYMCESLTTIAIPDSVTILGSGAFEHCTGLTDITLPNSLTSIDESTFEYCSGLVNVTIPNSITSIGKRAFRGCKSLRSIKLPNSLISIGSGSRSNGSHIVGGAFMDCTSLTNITIPSGVSNIGCDVFQGCKSLSSVTILNRDAQIDNTYNFWNATTFYGYTGSTTETFANANGYTFVALDA